MESSEKFDQWAVVEVMGHSRYAGRVTEQAIGGTSFVRVDVPEVEGRPAFTKLLGSSSIFCITPCEEAFARAAAGQFRSSPCSIVYMPTQTASVGALAHDDDDRDDPDEEWPI